MDASLILALLGTLLAIGLWVDQATFQDRKRRPNSAVQRNEVEIYRDALLSSYAVVYERLLGPSAFGRKSFLVVLIYYLVVFILISVISQPEWFKYSEVPIEFLIICVFGGYVTTWVSIQQTRIFSYEAIFSESRFSRVVFLLSDLLTSSNLIIYLYSVFVALGIMAFQMITLSSAYPDDPLEARVTSMKISNPMLESFGLNAHPDFEYTYVFTISGKNPEGDWISASDVNVVSDEPFLHPSSLFTLHKSNRVDFTAVGAQAILYSEAEIRNDALAFMEKFASDIKQENAPEIELGNLPDKVSGADFSIYSVNLITKGVFYSEWSGGTYRKAFESVDSFEDSFWGIFYPIFGSWAGGAADPRVFEGQVTGAIVIDCADIWTYDFAVTEPRFDAKDCEEHIISGTIESLNNLNFIGIGDTLSALYHPVAPIFYAGIIPSILFYISILGYVVFAFAGRLMLGTPVLNSLVVRTPFTLSFVGVGGLLLLVFLAFSNR
ncbi:MAG: hypothetical protein AAF822_02805 [Pseudomonadota bacterium]